MIPFNKYEAFGELGNIEEENRLQKIREILSEIKEERLLYYNTLKFCLEFFQELVTYQKDNKMTAYNVAVTVAPNIFRPKSRVNEDLTNAGIYYDAFIRMI